MDNQEIGRRIKYARELRNETLEAVAQDVGVARSTIQRYENGKIDKIKLPVIESIAKALVVNPAWLSGKTDDMSYVDSCPDCGWVYDRFNKKDTSEHQKRHKAWEKAVEKFGELYCGHIEREKIKAENRHIRDDSSRPLDERYKAELTVLRCLFSRSLEANEYDLNHASFDEYVAMMMNTSYKMSLDKELSDKIIKNYGTMPGIEEGKSYYWPSYTKLCPNRLLSSEKFLLERYRTLDATGRQHVETVLDWEIDRVEQKESPTAIIEIFPTRKYLQSASAGYGDFNDDDSYEILELIKQPPLGTSFIVTVNGDSMEPTYLDGSLLFVKAQETIEIGQIGLFVKAGNLYIKELGENCLISHNKNYPAIYPEPNAPILTQGKIIGVCSEDYLPQ